MAKPSKQPNKNSQSDRLARIRRIFLLIIALVALAGLTDATYLTVAHLSGDTAVCGESHGCSEVLNSVYASFRGIPTAAFGALGYFSAFSAATLVLFGYRWARSLLFAVVTVMFAATLGFLYLQAAVINAFCPFCLLSAAFTFCMMGLILASPPIH
jgi:uncharacterized membrane protein